MRFAILFLTLFIAMGNAVAQTDSAPAPRSDFIYLNLKGEFDLLVDYSMVNPECADKHRNLYSIIIGTTVVGDNLERISVLVPCLSNEFVAGDLIVVKPIKTPKKNIVYAIRSFTQDGVEHTELFGAEYRAVWGEVVDVL